MKREWNVERERERKKWKRNEWMRERGKWGECREGWVRESDCGSMSCVRKWVYKSNFFFLALTPICWGCMSEGMKVVAVAHLFCSLASNWEGLLLITASECCRLSVTAFVFALFFHFFFLAQFLLKFYLHIVCGGVELSKREFLSKFNYIMKVKWVKSRILWRLWVQVSELPY